MSGATRRNETAAYRGHHGFVTKGASVVDSQPRFSFGPLDSVDVSRSQRARWWNTAVLAGGGFLLSCALFLLGYLGVAVIAIALSVGLASLTAPLHRSGDVGQHWNAQDDLVKHGRVIVYWRPGCLFCLRLRLRLGTLAQRASWVDIWSDPEAAAFVRDVNGGAETVPTVILPGGEARTNPDPALVRSVLAPLRGETDARSSGAEAA